MPIYSYQCEIMISMLVIFMIVILMTLVNDHESLTNPGVIDPTIGSDVFRTRLTDGQKDLLFKTMSLLHDALNSHGIDYMICFGTLLGAVRHRDLIPWDDDIDILIHRKDIARTKKMVETLGHMNGWKIINTYKLIQIIRPHDGKELSIDIFFYDLYVDHDNKEKVERCLNDSAKCQKIPKQPIHKWWHDWWHFPKQWLDGRKMYHINKYQFWGPSNPIQLLYFWYGNDCMTNCQSPEYDHNTQKYIATKNKDCPTDLPVPQLD